MGNLKILFVCSNNQHRSKTAETLYKEDQRFEVKAAELNELANQQANPVLMNWADYIFVMERVHEERLRTLFPALYDGDKVFNLEIEDHYDYMDERLAAIMKSKFEDAYFLFIEN